MENTRAGIGMDRSRSPMRDITSDPATIRARVFVSSLPEEVTIPDLEDHFSQWGKLVGVTMNKNKFAFIQFENEADARVCVLGGRNSVLLGQKLHIKHAVLDKTPAVPNYNNSASGLSNTTAAAVAALEYLPTLAEYYDSYYRDQTGGRGASAGATDYYRSAYDPYGQARAAPDSASAYPIGGVDAMDPLNPNRSNDVEIVLPDKSMRSFGESIEARLKQLGMLVDLLFPPSDIPPSRVLADLASRKCLYVVFVSPDNKTHNSVTVHILHGERQEHRNMPIDDAVNLLQHNFDKYVRETRVKNAQRQGVPREIRNLLLDLLETQAVSMGDLDKLIKYLRERQNALVDNQIELKRETTAGNHNSAAAPAGANYMGGNMAVSYPGYNYMPTGGVPQPGMDAGQQGAQPMMTGMQGAHGMDPSSNGQNPGANSAAAMAGYAGYPAAYNAVPPGYTNPSARQMPAKDPKGMMGSAHNSVPGAGYMQPGQPMWGQ